MGSASVLESEPRCLLAGRNGMVAVTRLEAQNTSAVRGSGDIAHRSFEEGSDPQPVVAISSPTRGATRDRPFLSLPAGEP